MSCPLRWSTTSPNCIFSEQWRRLPPPPTTTTTSNLHPLPQRVLLILIQMESLSLHWREYEGWGIFRRCRLAALPSAGVGSGREHRINADAIDEDVGPYVENTIHKKYRLLVRSRLISESALPYWFQLWNPLQSDFHQMGDESEVVGWRRVFKLWTMNCSTDEKIIPSWNNLRVIFNNLSNFLHKHPYLDFCYL